MIDFLRTYCINTLYNKFNSMCIKQQITDIIQKYPRHYSRMIQQSDEMKTWVADNTLVTETDPFTQQIYSALYQVSNQCAAGNKRRFIDIHAGFGFCGSAGKCQCARESVAKKISDYQKAKTPEERLITSNKRQNTTFERYGVVNNAQTAMAKQRHSEFYANTENIKTQRQKYVNTLKARYGVSDISELPAVKEKRITTNIEKYGVSNPQQNPVINEKTRKTKRENFDPAVLYANNFSKFVKTLAGEWNVVPLITSAEYQGVASRPTMMFKCISCGHEFEKRFDYASPPVCKVCHPTETKFQSGEELALYDFIQSVYSGPIVQNDRSIINPYELDIVLPQLKIAIEYCGLYWHSERSGNKAWNYHYTKMKLANDAGYRLITIFGDEWNIKPDIVKSKIKSILGLTTSKIGARQCTLQQVDYKEAVKFLNNYHIQGSPKRLGKCVGLYFKNTLVALGCFVKTDSSYELVRFATSMRVVGGAGKILREFISLTPDCHSVISFSDSRWSSGNMYQSMGFIKNSEVPPMQTYVSKYTERHHKLMFSRKKITSASNSGTEWEIMKSLGYDRIWDCGKVKWEFNTGRLTKC